MTKEQLLGYLSYIENSGLVWDSITEAKEILMKNGVDAFKAYFSKLHCTEITELLFKNPSKAPLYLNGNKNDWLNVTAEWMLSQEMIGRTLEQKS